MKIERMLSKMTYVSPQIEIIKLDNEISLALESSPPVGPEEGANHLSVPEYFSNNPLKDSIV